MRPRYLKAVALAAALVTALPTARAETIVFTSTKPYWLVGVRDKALSQACSLGRFNIRKASRLVARFTGPEGAETLNIGRGTGFNLYDPDRHAKPGEDYYFRNQNSTSCEVFVGGRKGGGGRATGPARP
ncbi:MAG: hypothetical protein JO010_13805 [Alphaproteobacteria bacterium]|nr:hypothetical protein [Alphaproteobacteria bacterium]